jgi:hypothetical protein
VPGAAADDEVSARDCSLRAPSDDGDAGEMISTTADEAREIRDCRPWHERTVPTEGKGKAK